MTKEELTQFTQSVTAVSILADNLNRLNDLISDYSDEIKPVIGDETLSSLKKSINEYTKSIESKSVDWFNEF